MNNITNPINTQRHASSNPANMRQAEVNSAVKQVQHSSSMPKTIPVQGNVLGKEHSSTLTPAEKSRITQIKTLSVAPFSYRDDELMEGMGDVDPFAEYFLILENLTKATSEFQPSEAFLNSAYYLMARKVDLGYNYRMEAAEKIPNEEIKQAVLNDLKKEFGAESSVPHSSSMPKTIPAQGNVLGEQHSSTLTPAEKSRITQIKTLSLAPFSYRDDELMEGMGDVNPLADYFLILENLTKASSEFQPSEAFLNSAYYLMARKVDLGYHYRMEAAEKIPNKEIKQAVLSDLKKEFSA